MWIIAVALLSSCDSTEKKIGVLDLGKDVVVITYLSTSGGALGEESYRVVYRYDGKEKAFFAGVNPRDFSVTKQGESVSIRFCHGTVSLAEPIFLAPPRSELIPLDLTLDCTDRG